MNKIRKIAIMTLLYVVCSFNTAYCIIGPTLMLDKEPKDSTEVTYGIGPVLKYKHNKASEQDFEGDMAMWGLRVFAGRMNDPEFGIIYSQGHQNSDTLKYNLEMTGLTFEDSFNSDPRFKWRFTAGFGTYKLKSIASGHVYNDGKFAYLEPMILGILPLNRNIILEFGVGYTFADASKVRVEGLALSGELLFGKF